VPTLDLLADYLAAQGAGTVKTSVAQPNTPWLIYKGTTPPGDRSDIITLTMYPGTPPLEVMGSGTAGVIAEEPRVQVTARNLDYAVAMAKAETLWTILHNYSGTLSGVRILRISCASQPYPIGRDDETRFMMGFSMSVSKERG
jgi:hypothetical protein